MRERHQATLNSYKRFTVRYSTLKKITLVIEKKQVIYNVSIKNIFLWDLLKKIKAIGVSGSGCGLMDLSLLS